MSQLESESTNGLRAICAVGYPGSGKSEAETLAREYGFPSVSMGDQLRAHAVQEHGESILDREGELGEFATKKREEEGDDVVAQWTIEHLKAELSDSSDTVFVDGVRSLAEIRAFEELISEFVIIFISVPLDVRVHRIRERGRSPEEKNATMGMLRDRDAREAKWGLDELVEQQEYDYRIENTGSMEEFRESVLTVFRQESQSEW